MNIPKQPAQRSHTPKQYAASVAFDALYYALLDKDLLPDDTNVYRKRVRSQIRKLMAKLANQNGLDYALTSEQEN